MEINKKYYAGMVATCVLTLVAAAALMFSTGYLPSDVSVKAKQTIERLKAEGADPEVIRCYIKTFELQRKEYEKDRAYASLVSSFCLLFALNGVVQLYILTRLRSR
ncbi:hypothetical protein [Desulfurobacterium sp.]